MCCIGYVVYYFHSFDGSVSEESISAPSLFVAKLKSNNVTFYFMLFFIFAQNILGCQSVLLHHLTVQATLNGKRDVCLCAIQKCKNKGAESPGVHSPVYQCIYKPNSAG